MSSTSSNKDIVQSSVSNSIEVSGTPPTPGFAKTSADEKKSRRTSLQVLLPKLPSSESLSNSSPASPGLTNWADSSPRFEIASSDKLADPSKLNRKESYKAQRKNYRREKKRVASELLNSLQDPAIIVLADWLKVRGTLKSWTKLWCVLKPGLLLLYKSPKTKSSHWVGTILLTSCQIIERPSKKDGFCFKLFHPLDQSIWAPRGPDKETMGAVVQPLPTAYLIFRAPSQAAGKCWMDALELSLRCSALLLRSASNSGNNAEHTMIGTAETMTHETQWSEADYEKHFYDHAKYIPPTPPDNRISSNDLRRQITNSPCPSPTPIFQKLYIAVSHWERILADSPNILHEKHRIIKDLESLGTQNNCFFPSSRDDGDDTDDECSNEPSPIRYSAENVNAIRFLDGKIFQKSISNDTQEGDSNHLDIDSQGDGANAIMSGLESESESECEPEEEFAETQYIHCPEDEFGAAGEQVEELADEHKSLIWFLVKQVRPGMDLSKVVLPTFILEPRSFLDKLSDSYYHADYLSNAVLEDDPFNRMKMVVQWYMSGFYKKPKGLKKPYNPILGETFRCYWEHPNGSRTFYIAEQVSHHPPISAFYVTNRQDGFSISCSMLAKSKFYGNSTSAILEGTAALTLLPRGETYTLTIPYAHCKGILMGTLSMELGGKIAIECENTGYKADVEFKLKPFLGGSEYTNLVTARIKLGKETLASINGHWDGEIKIKDTRSGEETVLFSPTADVRSKRLKRFTVPIESQGLNESERLWQHVSAAIHRDDQIAATEEKTALEESQRALVKERKATCTEWTPILFHQDLVTGQWHYKCADLRPWDPRNDLRQYESNYKIQTKTRHQAPMVRTASIISSEPIILQADSRSSLAALKKSKRILGGRKISTPDLVDASDSSHSNELSGKGSKMQDSIDNINKQLMEQSKKISSIQLSIDRLSFAPRQNTSGSINIQTILYVGIGLLIHSILMWLIMRK